MSGLKLEIFHPYVAVIKVFNYLHFMNQSLVVFNV